MNALITYNHHFNKIKNVLQMDADDDLKCPYSPYKLKALGIRFLWIFLLIDSNFSRKSHLTVYSRELPIPISSFKKWSRSNSDFHYFFYLGEFYSDEIRPRLSFVFYLGLLKSRKQTPTVICFILVF